MSSTVWSHWFTTYTPGRKCAMRWMITGCQLCNLSWYHLWGNRQVEWVLGDQIWVYIRCTYCMHRTDLQSYYATWEVYCFHWICEATIMVQLVLAKNTYGVCGQGWERDKASTVVCRGEDGLWFILTERKRTALKKKNILVWLLQMHLRNHGWASVTTTVPANLPLDCIKNNTDGNI